MVRLLISWLLAVAVTGLLAGAVVGQDAPPLAVPGVSPGASAGAGSPSSAAPADKAAAYYHYLLACQLEEEAEVEGRQDAIPEAIEQLREAMHADPASPFLADRMADLLFRVGRTGDAIRMARSVTREHPRSADAHELLGDLYLHLLGDIADVGASSVLPLAIEQYQALVRLRPADADAHGILGRLYRANRQPGLAAREFETALRLNGNSPETVANLVELYAEQGELGLAEQAFDSVPAPARTAPLEAALGYAYERHRDYADAARAYQAAVQMAPGDLRFHRGLAQSLYLSGDLAQARSEYRFVAGNDPEDARVLLRLVQIDRELGRFSDAENDLIQARKLVPDSPELAYDSALVYESEGKDAAAAASLADLLQRSARPNGQYSADEASDRAILLEKLGTLERQTGAMGAALGAFRQMEALGTDSAIRGELEMVETDRQQHDYAAAVAEAATAARQFPGRQELVLSYALLLADTGQNAAALGQLEPLLQGNGQDRAVDLAIAQVDEDAHRWGVAEKCANQALALAHDNSERAAAEVMLGDLADRQKKYGQAELHLRRALQWDPANAETLNYLGYLLADRGKRLDQALGYIQKAVRAESDNGAYLDSLGWVYFKLNRLPEAIANLRRAAQLQRDDPVILDHLSMAYFSAGNWIAAENALNQALAAWQSSAPADYDASEVEWVRKALLRVQKLEKTRAANLPRPQ